MSKKSMMLALAAVSAAVFALPVAASAAETPTVTFSSKNTHFTVSGGHAELRAGTDKITCTTVSGTGEWSTQTAATTGTVQYTFHGCREKNSGFDFTCGTSGTITTNKATFHTTYLTDNKTSKGVWITEPTGGFANFSCATFISLEITGSIMGAILTPECGKTSASSEVAFSATGAVQEHQQVTGTGTKFHLNSSKFKNPPVEAGEQASGVQTLTEGTGTLTCD